MSNAVKYHYSNTPERSFENRVKELEYEFFQNFTSPHTRKCYARDIRQFLEFLKITFPEVENIALTTRFHIVAYKEFLIKKEYAPKTTNRKLSAISSYLDFLVEKGFLSFNPSQSIRRPRQEVVSPTNDLSDEEVIRLLEYADDKETSPLHRAILYLLFTTGIRKSELINLKIKDFKMLKNQYIIEITAKGGKQLTKLVPEITAIKIQDYLSWMRSLGRENSAEMPLFRPNKNPNDPTRLDKHLAPKAIDYCLKQACLKAHISHRLSPHSARATYIGSALENGADLFKVSQDVGHASVKTTQEYNKRRMRLKDSPVHNLGFLNKKD